MKDAASCVDKLQVLAEGARLGVLRRLMTGPCTVGQLREALGVEQSLLSHHLRVLRDEGFVTATRRGKSRVYRLAGGAVGRGRALDLGCCRLQFD